jgi:hypothetical protein
MAWKDKYNIFGDINSESSKINKLSFFTLSHIANIMKLSNNHKFYN